MEENLSDILFPHRSKINRHQVIFWFLITLLLILRLPILGLTTYLVPSTFNWVVPLYEIGTYTIIAFLIWWERDNLQLHHMDGLAIFLIIIFKPLSTLILHFWIPSNPLAFPKIISFAFFIPSVTLLILILRKKIKIKNGTWHSIRWFIAGGFFGVLLMIIEGIIMIKYLNSPFPINPGAEAWFYPIYQIGFAAVPEEPLFRGFLWGGMKKAGLKDFWILITQTVAFTLAHIYYLNTPKAVLYLIIIFINSLCMGILVWKSRLLSSTIAFHGFANGSILAQYWMYSLLFK
jgi:membrane protease YdiL (CAAX protease family)